MQSDFKEICKLFDSSFKDIVALTDGEGLSKTYGEIYQAAFELHLEIEKPNKGERKNILLYMNPDTDFIISLYAILMAGHTPFLVTMDLKNELTSLSKHFSTILLKEDFREQLSKYLDLNQFELIKFQEKPVSGHPYKKFDVDIYDSFINSHSSGSTGTPKVIPGTFKKYLRSTEGESISGLWSKTDTVLSLAPLNHAYGLLVGLFVPFYYGAKVRISKGGFSFQDICNEKIINGVSIIVSTPPVFNYLCELMDTMPKTFFKDCRYFLSAAAKLEDSVILKLRDYFNLHLFEIYGTTEALIIGTRDTSKSLQWKFEKELAWKVNDKNELSIKIFYEPGKTEAAWQETGDLVLIEDEARNIFSISGRSQSFIKIKGIKVFTHEIEDVLSKINLIKEVVVLKHKNEEEAVAFIVARSNEDKKELEKEIRKLASENIARSRVPKYIKMLDNIPKNKTGKIIKSELEKLV